MACSANANAKGTESGRGRATLMTCDEESHSIGKVKFWLEAMWPIGEEKTNFGFPALSWNTTAPLSCITFVPESIC